MLLPVVLVEAALGDGCAVRWPGLEGDEIERGVRIRSVKKGLDSTTEK